MSEKEAEKKGDEGGDGSAAVTLVLRAGLHCEGCAHKVKRSIKHMDGVESVKTNYATGKVTVVGKVDPSKVKERVEEKTKKTAQLVSPKPPKKVKECGDQNSDKKPPEKKPVDDKKADEEKPKEAAATTVVFKTRVHCDSCARKMNKIINKCEGVEDVNVDMEKDKITVKGTMDMEAMLPYLNTKLKRAVEIAPPPQEDDGSDKRPESGGDKKGEEAMSQLSNGGDEGNEDVKLAAGEGSSKPPVEEKEGKVEIVNKMEHNGTKADEYGAHSYHPQEAQGKGYVVEYWNGPVDYYMNGSYDTNAPPPYYLHAPEMFSDENPNSCSVM